MPDGGLFQNPKGRHTLLAFFFFCRMHPLLCNLTVAQFARINKDGYLAGATGPASNAREWRGCYQAFAIV
jgi:hypothetical protein